MQSVIVVLRCFDVWRLCTHVRAPWASSGETEHLVAHPPVRCTNNDSASTTLTKTDTGASIIDAAHAGFSQIPRPARRHQAPKGLDGVRAPGKIDPSKQTPPPKEGCDKAKIRAEKRRPKPALQDQHRAKPGPTPEGSPRPNKINKNKQTMLLKNARYLGHQSKLQT